MRHPLEPAEPEPSRQTVAVTCRWVPGTLDQVRVTRADRRDASQVVPIGPVCRLAGAGVRDALYLTGRAEFTCATLEWRTLTGALDAAD